MTDGDPLLVSQRIAASGPGTHLAYGAWNEAEDVLVDSAGVGIGVLSNRAVDRATHFRRVAGRVVRRGAGRSRLLPATADLPACGDTDNVFFLARGPWDLPLLERLRPLRRNDVTVSVWMPEVWPSELDDRRLPFEAYCLVDHVFVGVDEAVEPLHRIAPKAEIHVLPPATDVVRFAPQTADLDRPIAVLGIGRRDPAQHDEILAWAKQRHALYLYDTVKGSALDWRQHREALADWYQNATVAICNYAKHDVPTETGGLKALPGRLFEGLAGGAVLVGMPPDEERQRAVLGAAVVEPVGAGAQPLTELLDRFSDPSEARPVQLRNMALACRAHDWGHRWRAAFDALGMKTPPGLQERLDQLGLRALELDRLAVSG